MNILAVIPARGGSKSIPLKTIKDFCGKPLIAWTIESAKASKNITHVCLSTDSQQIADVAKKYGAEAPFLRPAELAHDSIGVEPTLKHAYEWYKNNMKFDADAVILLMPTTPTRQTFHLDEMIEIFKKTGVDSVVAVNQTPANHTPYWTLVRQPDGKVTLWGGVPLKKILNRRQDFPEKCYARNDLGYVLKPKNLYDPERCTLYGDSVELYDTADPAKYEMDINTPDEWAASEVKFRQLFLNNTSL